MATAGPTLNLPKGLGGTQPGQPSLQDPYTFDHVPSLKELLPRYRGHPGYQYAQIAVVNQRRAQDEGWYEVQGGVVYRIIGPRGYADMKLMVRGQRVIGQGHDSGARLCVCDGLVEPMTGLWINPHLHPEEPYYVEADQEEDAGSEDGSQLGEAVGQDPEGASGGPEAVGSAGSGEGGGNPATQEVWQSGQPRS